MTAIQCPGCNAHVSVKSATNCPRCQAHLPRSAPATSGNGKDSALRDDGWKPSTSTAPHARHATVAPAVSTAAPTSSNARNVFAYAVLGAIAVLIALIAYRLVVPSEDKLYARKVSAALLQCQQRIAGLAEFGGAETPPYTKNYGKADEFYFAWQRGSFHFMNGSGAQEKMSAS
jgi:hypothetical protein